MPQLRKMSYLKPLRPHSSTPIRKKARKLAQKKSMISSRHLKNKGSHIINGKYGVNTGRTGRLPGPMIEVCLTKNDSTKRGEDKEDERVFAGSLFALGSLQLPESPRASSVCRNKLYNSPLGSVPRRYITIVSRGKVHFRRVRAGNACNGGSAAWWSHNTTGAR